MSNPWFNASGYPDILNRGASAQAKTQFAQIGLGFDAAYTAVQLKADITSPAFLGVPTAPTAPAGTGTTQLATCAFVVAQAFSTSLPGQTGSAGRMLSTDGANASWGPVLGAWVNLTASTTLTNNRAHRFATTGQTYTTPASAGLMDGDMLLLLNTGTDVTNVVTANSGQTIVGVASRNIDVPSLLLKWCAALNDWRWV